MALGHGSISSAPPGALSSTSTSKTSAKVFQLAVEVLSTNTAVKARVAQLAVEVLRPNVVVASGARPQVFICT